MARSSKTDSLDDRHGLMIQVLGVLLLAVGLLCLVSLVSHSPEDPPNSSRPPELSENLAGWFGAHLSYRLLFMVGFGGYALNGLLFVWGWFLFRREPLIKLGWQTVSVLVLMALFCAASGVPSSGRTHQAFQFGGWLGVTLSSQLLVPYLGLVGSAIFLGTTLIVLAMVATDLPIARLPELLGRGVCAGVSGVAGGVGRLLAWIGNLRADLFAWLVRKRDARLIRKEERAIARAEQAEAEAQEWDAEADDDEVSDDWEEGVPAETIDREDLAGGHTFSEPELPADPFPLPESIILP